MWFLWPETLWLLSLLPLLVAGYFWLLARRQRTALRYPGLDLVKGASARHWRRHAPATLLLAAFGVLVVAAARPVAMVTLPTAQQTIILAMDVSGSMSADDIAPNRLVASQIAAKNFIDELPRNVSVGVVAFAGAALLIQKPTLSREEVVEAIDRLRVERATAIGSAILVSLATFFPDATIDRSAAHRDTASQRARAPVAAGSYASGAIILLTDGESTTGPDPIAAARAAADRGVKVYTVGFGTKHGEPLNFAGWSMRVRLDEETLRRVADLTRGEYFYAGSATDLSKVYSALNARVVLKKRETEITSLFAYAAAALLLLGAGLSLWWHGRVS